MNVDVKKNNNLYYNIKINGICNKKYIKKY